MSTMGSNMPAVSMTPKYKDGPKVIIAKVDATLLIPSMAYLRGVPAVVGQQAEHDGNNNQDVKRDSVSLP